MAEQQVGEIRISSRIAIIGHQVYPLANIARIQTLHVVRAGRSRTFYPLRTIVFLLVLVVGVTTATVVLVPKLAPRIEPNTDLDVARIAHQVAGAVTVLAAIWILWLLAVIVHRLNTPQQYVLTIETSGTQYTALTGTDYNEIRRIEWAIVAAIERPPAHEQVLRVSGDVVFGDKVGRDKNVNSGAGSAMNFNR